MNTRPEPRPEPLHRRPSRARPIEPPLDLAGLISRSDALAVDWTDDAIAHAIQGERWQRVKAGLYTPVVPRTRATPYDEVRHRCLQHAWAGVRCSPRTILSHDPAAIVWGLPTLPRPRPCVSVAPGTALRRLTSAHLHRATLADSDRASRDGYPVTSIARTVLDIAREHGVDAGVMATDAALHDGRLSPSDLAEALQACRRWPGREAARLTFALCDARAESPLESVSRLRLTAAHLPNPQLQVEVCDEFGRFIARCDFYWPAYGVVGEADGEQKYQSRDDLLDERRRQRRLEDVGLIVERWGWADLGRFDEVAARLRRAFVRAQLPGRDRRWGVLTLRSDSGLIDER